MESSVRDVDTDVNYYKVLGVDPGSTKKEIKKAYRKLALTLHPDKQVNPTKESLRQFHLVQVGYELLMDDESRKALDTLLSAKHRASQKKAAMSNKRRKLQEELEKREQSSQKQGDVQRAKMVLKQHLDRLRAENRQRMVKHTQLQADAMRAASVAPTTVGVKWSKKKSFQEQDVRNALEGFGTIVRVLMGPKRGRATVVFADAGAAKQACSKSGRIGAFKIKLKKNDPTRKRSGDANTANMNDDGDGSRSQMPALLIPYSKNYTSLEEYESVVLGQVH